MRVFFPDEGIHLVVESEGFIEYKTTCSSKAAHVTHLFARWSEQLEFVALHSQHEVIVVYATVKRHSSRQAFCVFALYVHLVFVTK